MHIRLLSDPWTPHPDAMLPVLRTAPSMLLLSDLSAIQIHHRHVAWMQFSDTGFGSQIEIWDWQAGRMIWVRVDCPDQHASLTPLCTTASSIRREGFFRDSRCSSHCGYARRLARPSRLSDRSSVGSFDGCFETQTTPWTWDGFPGLCVSSSTGV